MPFRARKMTAFICPPGRNSNILIGQRIPVLLEPDKAPKALRTLVGTLLALGHPSILRGVSRVFWDLRRGSTSRRERSCRVTRIFDYGRRLPQPRQQPFSVLSG